MTVGDLGRRLSARELNEWMAYFRIEPFGEEMAELRTGILAATIVNAQPSGKRGRRPVKPEQFMPVHQANKAADAKLRPPDRRAIRNQVLATLAAVKTKGKPGGRKDKL